jgi:methylglyoxal/glyoxal reductase
MHCETTIDPTGTWRHSYRALERLYQEGHLLSIGVSNFNRPLLDQLTTFATVMPHAIQNHGEIHRYDLDVRRWCKSHQVIYMPYATGRNLKNLPSPVLETLGKFSKSYNVSKNAISSQLFLQSGAVIIPRSTNPKHLEENIKLLSWELTSRDRSELGWNEKSISEEDQILFSYRSEEETRSEVLEVNPGS